MSGIIARARDPSCLRARVHACRKKDGPKAYHSAEGPSEGKAEATESLPWFFSQIHRNPPQSNNIQTNSSKTPANSHVKPKSFKKSTHKTQ
jgi:hypothetical protein